MQAQAKLYGCTPLLSLLLTLIWMLHSISVKSEERLFEIDPLSSVVTLSGTFADAALQEQEAGSLKLRLRGAIQASLTNSSLSIIAANLDFTTNGVWSPGRLDSTRSPADAAAKAETFFGLLSCAFRDMFLFGTADAMLIDGQGHFEASI